MTSAIPVQYRFMLSFSPFAVTTLDCSCSQTGCLYTGFRTLLYKAECEYSFISSPDSTTQTPDTVERRKLAIVQEVLYGHDKVIHSLQSPSCLVAMSCV